MSFYNGGVKLKWSNLPKNKCPKCDKEFDSMVADRKLGYLSCKCGYYISIKRFSEIVNSRVTQDLERKWDQEQEGGEI